jgi:hypothetical protein
MGAGPEENERQKYERQEDEVPTCGHEDDDRHCQADQQNNDSASHEAKLP